MTATRIELLHQLKSLLPGEIVLEPATLEKYAGDKWFAAHQPDAVALPRSTQSVSKILRFANGNKIPVTPRGAGHGYVGGCVPVRGGIVLSLERMNRIKEINAADFVAVVQPAVITAKLQAAVEKRGLFYPPDPASRADNFIGGNIATNAGGPRCLKYGVTRDYVLGLEVVLADGTVIRTGGRTHKNKTGFDFTRLFAGSEGLLGVITEATLKLIPLPPFRATMAVGFGSMKNAVGALQADSRRRFFAQRAGTGRRIHARRRRQIHRQRPPRHLQGAFDRRAGRPEKIRARRAAGGRKSDPQSSSRCSSSAAWAMPSAKRSGKSAACFPPR